MWGRSRKVSLSRYRFRQVPEWAHAPVELWDAQGFSSALPWSVCLLSWPPGSGVSQQFRRLLSPSGGRSGWLRGFGYWMWSTWCIEEVRPQQITRTRWFTLRSVLEVATRVCVYSDGYVQPLVHPGSHPWKHYQGCDHNAEEMSQACLGGFRWLHLFLATVLETAGFKPDSVNGSA